MTDDIVIKDIVAFEVECKKCGNKDIRATVKAINQDGDMISIKAAK